MSEEQRPGIGNAVVNGLVGAAVGLGVGAATGEIMDKVSPKFAAAAGALFDNATGEQISSLSPTAAAAFEPALNPDVTLIMDQAKEVSRVADFATKGAEIGGGLGLAKAALETVAFKKENAENKWQQKILAERAARDMAQGQEGGRGA